MASATPVEVIIKKREGKALTDDEVIGFVNGFTEGSIPDYQCSSFLMAVNCRGMNEKVRPRALCCVRRRAHARARRCVVLCARAPSLACALSRRRPPRSPAR